MSVVNLARHNIYDLFLSRKGMIRKNKHVFVNANQRDFLYQKGMKSIKMHMNFVLYRFIWFYWIR